MKYINFFMLIIANSLTLSLTAGTIYSGVRTYCFYLPQGGKALTYEKLSGSPDKTMANFNVSNQTYFMTPSDYARTVMNCDFQIKRKGETMLLKATDPLYPEPFTSFYPLKPETPKTDQNYKDLLNALGITRDDLKAAFSEQLASYKTVMQLPWGMPENFIDVIRPKSITKNEYVRSNHELLVLYFSGLISSYWFFYESDRNAFIPAGTLLLYDILTDILLAKKGNSEVIASWLEQTRPEVLYTSFFARGPNSGKSLFGKSYIKSFNDKVLLQKFIADALKMLEYVQVTSIPKE